MPLLPKASAQVIVAMQLDQFQKSLFFEDTWYCVNWPGTCRYAVTADPEFLYVQDSEDHHSKQCQYGKEAGKLETTSTNTP
jgi:hypothetical protein